MSSPNTGRPPDLSSSALLSLIQHLYPFTSIDPTSPKQLASYDDRNYYFRASLEDGQPVECVFKMYNHLNNLPEVVCGVSALMTHLQARWFPGTEQVASKKGGVITMVTDRELQRITSESGGGDHTHCVRVVRYVSGVTLDSIEKDCITPKLLFQVGQFLGKIDTALNGFADKAIYKRVLANFDLMHFETMYRKFISSVEDPDRRKMAQRVYSEYRAHVSPNVPAFKKGVIYNDAHTSNIIVRQCSEEYTVAAFIDFDDAVNSCYVFELAILLADVLAERISADRPIELVCPIISGYCQEFALCSEELSCLYYVVMARCCQVGMVTGVQHKNEPWNDYLLTSLDPQWKVVELLLETPKSEVDKIWTSAIGKTLEDYGDYA